MIHTSMIRVPTHAFTKIARETFINLPAYMGRDTFEKTAALAAQTFPRDIHAALHNFKQQENKQTYCLIRNLPSHLNLSTTSTAKGDSLNTFWLACFSALLGTSNTPTLGRDKTFQILQSEYICLFSPKEDIAEERKISISSIQGIRETLSPSLESILRQPLFKTSFIGEEGPSIPVIHGSKKDPLVMLNPKLMQGTSKAAQNALLSIEDLFMTSKETLSLVPGDLVIIDNLRAVHQRDFFLPLPIDESFGSQLFYTPQIHNFYLVPQP